MLPTHSPDLPSAGIPHIICIGDYMLDEFSYGAVTRISPEAPIPVLRQQRTLYALGGAGNVMRNLDALGQPAIALGIIDRGFVGSKVNELFEELPLIRTHFLKEQHWSTPHKRRFSANGQQLLRVDEERENLLTLAHEAYVMENLESSSKDISLIILSDYHKGTLTHTLCQKIIAFANNQGIFVLVDPKAQNFEKYRGASLITPNLAELAQAVGSPLSFGENLDDIISAAHTLQRTYDMDSLLVTMSHHGMLLCEKAAPPHYLSAQARDVFDVSGAGDTVVAGFAHILSQGKSLKEAAGFANTAAGIVVGKVGTAVVTKEEIEQCVWEHGEDDTKIFPLSRMLEKVNLWKTQHKKVGFTNGCFDLLHLGHLHLLQQARVQCDKLVVALNSDASVRRLKGDTRPIQHEHVRAHMLAALSMVDAVIIFDEDTPLRCIETLLPDVLIKGADYQVHQVVGGNIVQKNGGRVFLAELKDGFSTTLIVKKMQG